MDDFVGNMKGDMSIDLWNSSNGRNRKPLTTWLSAEEQNR